MLSRCSVDIQAPVAEGPLVTNDPAMPKGGIWMGHMYVQDMCNMRCVAVTVSGNTDYVKNVSQWFSH